MVRLFWPFVAQLRDGAGDPQAAYASLVIRSRVTQTAAQLGSASARIGIRSTWHVNTCGTQLSWWTCLYYAR
jgi:hypothetical protein